MMGARRLSTGSPAKSGVPSGTAKRSPVKRKAAQVIEEFGQARGGTGEAAQVSDIFVGESQVQEIIDGLGKPGGEDEVAIGGEAADGELERGDLVGFAGLEVSRRHGEFVEIGQQGVHRSVGVGRDARRRRPEGPAPQLLLFRWRRGACSFTPAAAAFKSSTAFASNYVDARLVLTLREILIALLGNRRLFDALAAIGGDGGFEDLVSPALFGELGGAQIAQLVDEILHAEVLSMVFAPDIHLSPVLV